MPRRPPAVARVLERLTATAREHVMFAPNDLVMVMVSGGPDSTCLLHALHQLRRLLKIRLTVVHVDHRLRPDSDKDAAYVRRQAERLNVPFVLRTAAGEPDRGASVEAWARTIRYAAATDAAHEAGADHLATAHTLDDQAETVLLQLVRGAGPWGITGISPVGGLIVDGVMTRSKPTRVRPLIDVRRSEVEAFCRALGLRPRMDPTNRDTRFLRNAIRLEALPALERATGRDVRGPIARSADLLRRTLEELGLPRTPEQFAIGKRVDGGYELYLDRHRDEGRRRRFVAYVLRELDAPVTEKAIAAVLDLADGRPGRRRNLGGGLLAVREREYIRIVRTSP